MRWTGSQCWDVAVYSTTLSAAEHLWILELVKLKHMLMTPDPTEQS